MIAPHATPAAAYAALAEFLTENAPPLIGVDIAVKYEMVPRQPNLLTYTAEIHVSENVFPAWLDLHGFAASDVQRGRWTDKNDVRKVTSHTGVTIYALTPSAAEGGESA